MDDLISRQAALDAIDKYILGEPEGNTVEVRALLKLIANIYRMPSAQAEPLTDKEQRIFLAAMGREEKVCKQVDDEYRECLQDFAEMYEDSLVRTCHEITRKVKGALWT